MPDFLLTGEDDNGNPYRLTGVDGAVQVQMMANDEDENLAQPNGDPAPEVPYPQAPTGLVATVTGDTIDIVWVAGADADSHDVTFDGNTTSVAVPATTAQFTGVADGTYTIEVAARNVRGLSPQTVTTANVAVTADPEPVIHIESHDAEVFGEFTVQANPDASEGQVVGVPDGTRSSTGNPSGTDFVRFTFTPAQSGTATIRVRATPVIGKKGSSDSAYWVIDGSTAERINHVETGFDVLAIPVPVTVTAGVDVVFEWHNREDGFAIDWAELDFDYVDTGGGGPVVTAPDAPTGANFGNDELAWSAGNANGAAITSYEVTVTPGSTQTVTAPPLALPGLADGAYTYSITATNSAGTSPALTGGFTVDSTPPVIPDPPAGGYSNLASLRADPTFTINDLPTERAKQAYRDFWESWANEKTMDPQYWKEMFCEGDTKWTADAEGKSWGTYDIGRNGGMQGMSVAEYIRATKDPAGVDKLWEMISFIREQAMGYWSTPNHDRSAVGGTDYPFLKYSNPNGNDPSSMNNDLKQLDEQLHAGNLAYWAWVMWENRHLDIKYAREAAYWFDYLLNNWIPRWAWRSSNSGPAKTALRAAVTPSAGKAWPSWVGGSNSKGWSNNPSDAGKTGMRADTSATNDYNNIKDDYTLPAQYAAMPRAGRSGNWNHPGRDYWHCWIMATAVYFYAGKFLTEANPADIPDFTGGFQTSDNQTGPFDSRTYDGEAMMLEAELRHNCWFDQVQELSDGGRHWSMDVHSTHTMAEHASGNPAQNTTPRGGGMYTSGYSQHIFHILFAFHFDWPGSEYANVDNMQATSRVITSPKENLYYDIILPLSGYADAGKDHLAFQKDRVGKIDSDSISIFGSYGSTNSAPRIKCHAFNLYPSWDDTGNMEPALSTIYLTPTRHFIDRNFRNSHTPLAYTGRLIHELARSEGWSVS